MHEMLSSDARDTEWSRVAPLLDAVIDELREEDRTAVLLRFIERRPFAHIGATLRLSEDAARMRVDRALEKLRVLLARRGIMPTSAALGVMLANEAIAAAPVGLAANVTNAALAGAVAGNTIGAAGGLAFMTTIQKTCGIAAILMLVTLSISIHRHLRTNEIEAKRDRFQQQAHVLRAELATITARNLELRKERAARTSPATGVASGVVSDAPRLTANDVIESEKRRLYFTLECRRLANHAFPLIEQLGLSREQLARYAEIAGRELSSGRFTEARSLDEYVKIFTTEWERETRELIGAEAFQRLVDLRRAQSAVEPLAEYLQASNASLQSRQAHDLLLYLARQPDSIRANGGIVDEQAVAGAQGMLSSAQLAAWRRLNAIGETRAGLIKHFRAADKTLQGVKPSGE